MPTPRDIAALRAKYEEMLRLRLLHDAGDETDPRRAMARLAQEFPGALREIDELPIDEIRARIEKLSLVDEDESAIEPWMRAVSLFHALTRGALCAKSWLSGEKKVTPATRAAFLREVDSLCYANDARAWTHELSAIANPPRGRITDLVFARMALELGIDQARARFLVFGAARRARLRVVR